MNAQWDTPGKKNTKGLVFWRGVEVKYKRVLQRASLGETLFVVHKRGDGMARYAFQRSLGGGSWTVVFDFEAADVEAAKAYVLERFVSGVDRASHGDTPFRIMEVLFEGTPEETGCLQAPTAKERELMDMMEEGRMRGWLHSGAMESELQQMSDRETGSD